jgi:hypothetical protein
MTATYTFVDADIFSTACSGILNIDPSDAGNPGVNNREYNLSLMSGSDKAVA